MLQGRALVVGTRLARRNRLPVEPIIASRLVTGGNTQLATPAPEANSPRQGHGAFDTYRFVAELEGAGVPRDQAVTMMNQVLLAISEANTRQIALVATKEDLLSLQSEINEKVFSSTLRYAAPEGVDAEGPEPGEGRRAIRGKVRLRKAARRDHRAGEAGFPEKRNRRGSAYAGSHRDRGPGAASHPAVRHRLLRHHRCHGACGRPHRRALGYGVVSTVQVEPAAVFGDSVSLR